MSDIYQQQEDRMTGRGKTSGGTGLDFWKFPKPSTIGQMLEYRFRIVQRLAMTTEGQQVQPVQPLPEFWLVVDQHGFRGSMVGSEQKWVSFTCPDTALHDEDDWRKRMTCPICILQNELWQLRDAAYKSVTDMLRWKTRVFANVIDLNDPQSHWKQIQVEGQGQQWQVRPKIYAFSKTTFKTFLGFCREYGPIEDWKNGRALKMTITKDGPQDMDVKYQFFPSDPAPVDQQLLPVVMGASDLSGLAKPATMDELQKVAALIDPRAGGAHTPAPGGYGGQSAPVQQGYQPPPPTPQHPAGSPGVVYHYNDGNASQEGLSAADVAKLIAGNPTANHQVWAPGWPSWADASGVQEISQVQAAMRPAAQPTPPMGGPPQLPGNGAGPPQPSGMPHNMPSPNPPQAGGQSGYAPQGGYPQPPQAPAGVNPQGNASGGPPMPGQGGGPPSF